MTEELAAARRVRPTQHASPVPWREDRDGSRLAIGGLVMERSGPLSEVLAVRTSERDLAPPTLAQLATLLIRCLRVAGWDEGPDGYVRTHRPTPSAGARHPIDVHLVACDVAGLDVGSWWFDPLACELVQSSGGAVPILRRLGAVVERPPPPAALVLVAHLDRTLNRYRDGMSLVWRDAGALLATLHLCATDLGLASCILGTTGVMTYELAQAEVDVGSLIVGTSSPAS